MTSRLASRNRVWSKTPLLSGSPTLAHAMSLAGYETTLIGQMRYVGWDQRQGFEQRPIGEYTARYPGAQPKRGKPWQHYPSSSAGQFRAGLEASGHGNTAYQYFDERVTQATCRFLKRRHDGQERPFMAVVGLVLQHNAYIAPKELYDNYFEGVSVPEVEDDLPECVRYFLAARGLVEPPINPYRTRITQALFSCYLLFGACLPILVRDIVVHS